MTTGLPHLTVLGTICGLPKQSTIYFLILPFIASLIGIFATIYSAQLIYSLFPEKGEHLFLCVYIMGPAVHFLTFNVISLYGNRMLFWRHNYTTYPLRLKLLALHILALLVVPTGGWMLYVAAVNSVDSYASLPVLFAIYSFGFHLIVLVPSLLTIRPILVDDRD